MDDNGVANMTQNGSGSTVPRRQLGRYLRDLREGAGMTLQGVATTLEWSRQRVWRMETAQVPVRPTDVEALCRLYRTEQAMTGQLLSLARETKAKGWWHSYGDDAVPPWFELYVGFEQTATTLRKYQADLVPGLLQTQGYTREVIDLDHPQMSPVDKALRLALRQQRQALLSRVLPPAPTLNVYLSEAVLRRPVPNRRAMREQLRFLARSHRRHNIGLRVVPLRAGLHAGAVAGSFTILDFPDAGPHPEPTIVYIESLAGALYLDKPAEVRTYTMMWASLSRLALSEEDSARLISLIAEEYVDE